MVSPDAPQRASDSPLSSTSTLCRDDKEGGVKLSPDEARTDASNRFYSSLHACQAAVELPQTPGQFLHVGRSLALFKHSAPERDIHTDEPQYWLQVEQALTDIGICENSQVEGIDSVFWEEEETTDADDVHDGDDRLLAQDTLGSWRHYVSCKQDRQSVLRYCETLYCLNLVRRALYAFLYSANDVSTQHVACQTSPLASPVACLAAAASPNARAKEAIKRSIHCTVGAHSYRTGDAASLSLCGNVFTAYVRGVLVFHRKRTSDAPLTLLRMPPFNLQQRHVLTAMGAVRQQRPAERKQEGRLQTRVA
jgi:hypothetical protein